MVKKILKAFMILLALIGIVISVSNFLPKLYSDTYFGTNTIIDQDNIAEYLGRYGIEGLNDRHVMNKVYCVDDSFDCVVHIVY
jgi:hypothetical protein